MYYVSRQSATFLQARNQQNHHPSPNPTIFNILEAKKPLISGHIPFHKGSTWTDMSKKTCFENKDCWCDLFKTLESYKSELFSSSFKTTGSLGLVRMAWVLQCNNCDGKKFGLMCWDSVLRATLLLSQTPRTWWQKTTAFKERNS